MSFKTKIPSKYHEQIFEWYTCGLSRQAIVAKMQQEYQVHLNDRTLGRLLAHMKEEKQEITEAVIAQQTQQQVLFNYQELASLYAEVRNLSKTAYKVDHNLYLRCLDRLTKLLQMQFGLHTQDTAASEVNEEEILQGLLDKLGHR